MRRGKVKSQTHVQRVNTLTEPAEHLPCRLRRLGSRTENQTVTLRLTERNGYGITGSENHPGRNQIRERTKTT